ncbi:hypothetical protein PRIPAC_82890, partial [Pristionchus pacificus]|uniref:Uncharacterized protein n=1 Tax=Pristionchus pacificus TaxID=54126 RepID=A0A2A6CLV8_PRIPA
MSNIDSLEPYYLVTSFLVYNDNYVVLAIALIYPLLILFGMRALIWQPYFIEFKGRSGTIFLYYTPDMNGLADVCAVEFTVNSIRTSSIRVAKRRMELGLYITTLCSFVLTLLFTIAQVCIQYFSFTLAFMYAIL